MHIVTCASTFDANGLPVIDGNSPKPYRKCLGNAEYFLANSAGRKIGGAICTNCLRRILLEYSRFPELFEDWHYIPDTRMIGAIMKGRIIHSSLAEVLRLPPDDDFPGYPPRIGVLATALINKATDSVIVEIHCHQPKISYIDHGEDIEISEVHNILPIKIKEQAKNCRLLSEELRKHAIRLEAISELEGDDLIQGLDTLDEAKLRDKILSEPEPRQPRIKPTPGSSPSDFDSLDLESL
jgi:hypothetical protein